jgi:hypothetical protein
MQMAASHTMKKMYTAKPTPPPQNQHQDSETEDCFKNGRIQDSEQSSVSESWCWFCGGGVGFAVYIFFMV